MDELGDRPTRARSHDRQGLEEVEESGGFPIVHTQRHGIAVELGWVYPLNPDGFKIEKTMIRYRGVCDRPEEARTQRRRPTGIGTGG